MSALLFRVLLQYILLLMSITQHGVYHFKKFCGRLILFALQANEDH